MSVPQQLGLRGAAGLGAVLMSECMDIYMCVTTVNTAHYLSSCICATGVCLFNIYSFCACVHIVSH